VPGEGQIAGQHDGASLVAFCDDVEEQARFLAPERQMDDLVDDEQPCPDDRAIEELPQAILLACRRKLHQQVGGRDQPRLDARLRRPIGQCARNVRLADTRLCEQNDVLGALDEHEAGQLLYLRKRTEQFVGEHNQVALPFKWRNGVAGAVRCKTMLRNRETQCQHYPPNTTPLNCSVNCAACSLLGDEQIVKQDGGHLQIQRLEDEESTVVGRLVELGRNRPPFRGSHVLWACTRLRGDRFLVAQRRTTWSSNLRFFQCLLRESQIARGI
jgi:hypothetical protein